MAYKKILSAFLVVVFLTSSIYFMMPDKVRIDIGKTNTKYSVWENEEWVLAATEYVNIYDGTTKMRAKSRELDYWEDSENAYVNRTSIWKDNITTVQTYTFFKEADRVEEFPIKNELACINCVGKIVHYEIRDILYEGITEKISSPFNFGHNMKIEWQDVAYYSKVFQQKSVDKIIIKYRPESDYEVYQVRLYDPIAVNGTNVSLELDAQYNFTNNETSNYSCIDIDHPEYGERYICGEPPFNVSFNISYFRKTEFIYKNETVTEANLNFTEIETSYCSDGTSCTNGSAGVRFFNNERVNVNVDIPVDEKINSLSFHQRATAGNNANVTLKICKDTDSNRICDGGNGVYDAQCSMVVSGTTYGWKTCQLDTTITTIAGDYILYFLQNDSSGIYISKTSVDNDKTYYETSETQPYGNAWDDVLLKANTHISNETIYINAHQYDEVVGLKFNLTGETYQGTIPKEVKVYINNSFSNYVGALLESTGGTLDTFDDGETSKNLSYSTSGTQIVYVKLPKNAQVSLATMDIEGFENEYMIKGTSSSYDATDTIYPGDVFYKQNMNITDTIYAVWRGVKSYDTMGLYDGSDSLIESFGTSSNKVYLATPYTPSAGEIISYQFTDSSTDPSFRYIRDRTETYWIEPVEKSGTLAPGYESYGSIFQTDVVNSMRLQIYGRSSPINPYIEIGAIDGIREWSYSGTMNVSETLNDFSSSINNYLVSCSEDDDGYCSIPIYVTLNTAGIFTVSGIEVTYESDINPVILSVNLTQDFLDSEEGYTMIPITIENQANGIVTISDFKYDYAGGNDSIQVTMYDSYEFVNSFREDNGNTSGSLEFTDAENITKHLYIRLSEDISSATMKLQGLPVINANLSDITYSQLVSSYSCTPTSGWSPACSNGVDGNMGTYASFIPFGGYNYGTIDENYNITSGAIIPTSGSAAKFLINYSVVSDGKVVAVKYYDYNSQSYVTLTWETATTNFSYVKEFDLPSSAFGTTAEVEAGTTHQPKIWHMFADNAHYYGSRIGYYGGQEEYTSDVWIEVGTMDGSYEWNHSGIFNTINTTGNMSAAFNTALNGGACDCTGCSIISEEHITTPDNIEVSTADSETGWYKVNYTDNPDSESASWSIYTNCSGLHNVTVFEDCRDGDTIQLVWVSNWDFPGTLLAAGEPQCYNYTSSSWIFMETSCSGTQSGVGGGDGYEGNIYDGDTNTYAGWCGSACTSGPGWFQSISPNPYNALYEDEGIYFSLPQDYCSIPITFHSDSTGKIDYDSISIIGNTNKTNSLIFFLINYYSKWDYAFPTFIEYLEFIPKTPWTSGVYPYGQTPSKPILNITNYGYGGKDSNFSVYLNESHECVNLTMSLTNNQSDGFILNDTWTNLFEFNYLNSSSLWMWADYNCTYSTWKLWQPDLYFRNCAEETICSEELV